MKLEACVNNHKTITTCFDKKQVVIFLIICYTSYISIFGLNEVEIC